MADLCEGVVGINSQITTEVMEQLSTYAVVLEELATKTGTLAQSVTEFWAGGSQEFLEQYGNVQTLLNEMAGSIRSVQSWTNTTADNYMDVTSRAKSLMAGILG